MGNCNKSCAVKDEALIFVETKLNCTYVSLKSLCVCVCASRALES